MIIECINCNKKFEVDPNFIPITGRNIQCGSCDYIWFFKKEKQLEINLSESKTNQVKRTTNVEIPKLTESIIKEAEKRLTTSKETKNLENSNLRSDENNHYKHIVKDKNIVGGFLSYFVVTIITFIGLIILLDTFKKPLVKIFPKLEILLFNLYETLKDIELFIKDLV